MNKNWKTSPWAVRLIFIYWQISVLMLYIAIGLFVTIAIDSNFGSPLAFFIDEYLKTPISLSIDIIYSIMLIFAGYYAWRLVSGSRFARKYLEVFTWITIVLLVVYLLFPEVPYLEMDSIPQELMVSTLLDDAIDWAFLIFGVAVLYGLRMKVVIEYSNSVE